MLILLVISMALDRNQQASSNETCLKNNIAEQGKVLKSIAVATRGTLGYQQCAKECNKYWHQHVLTLFANRIMHACLFLMAAPHVLIQRLTLQHAGCQKQGQNIVEQKPGQYQVIHVNHGLMTPRIRLHITTAGTIKTKIFYLGAMHQHQLEKITA